MYFLFPFLITGEVFYVKKQTFLLYVSPMWTNFTH